MLFNNKIHFASIFVCHVLFYGMVSVVQMFWLIFRSWETESVFNNVMEVRQFENYIHSQVSILCLSSQVSKTCIHISKTVIFFGIELFLPENKRWQVVPMTSCLPQWSGLLKHSKKKKWPDITQSNSSEWKLAEFTFSPSVSRAWLQLFEETPCFPILF